MENGKMLVGGISAGIAALLTYKLIKHYKALCCKSINITNDNIHS